jgi:hypothetical protein
MDAPSLAELRDVMDLANLWAAGTSKHTGLLYKMSNWLAALEGIEGTKGADVRFAAQTLETLCPQIEPMLAISTAHISKETAERLTNHALDAVTAFDHDNHGWLISVPDTVGWSGLEENVPLLVHDDLCQCMKMAQARGCCWLLLDGDAAAIEGLDTYEW